jgi:hypothetical protein
MRPDIACLLMTREYALLFPSQAFGQYHVTMLADGLSDVSEQEVRAKIEKSGSASADYDQCSSVGCSAYATSAGDIKAHAKGTFLSKQKEPNAGAVMFEERALQPTAPIDLKPCPMVAPPNEAVRSVSRTGNFDVVEFKSKVSVLPSEVAAPSV